MNIEVAVFVNIIIWWAWAILAEFRIRKLEKTALNHAGVLYRNALAMNISTHDLATFIKLSLQEKAKHSELTEDEKIFYAKSHAAIHETEKTLKQFK